MIHLHHGGTDVPAGPEPLRPARRGFWSHWPGGRTRWSRTGRRCGLTRSLGLLEVHERDGAVESRESVRHAFVSGQDFEVLAPGESDVESVVERRQVRDGQLHGLAAEREGRHKGNGEGAELLERPVGLFGGDLAAKNELSERVAELSDQRVRCDEVQISPLQAIQGASGQCR